MSTTQPIKGELELMRYREFYRTVRPDKRNYLLINLCLYSALRINDVLNLTGEDVFNYDEKCMHISRYQAYRIIRGAAEALHMENIVSPHSLRKTFGYHAWKQGIQPAMLMDIYNHSSYKITKRYLGINQDDRDNVFKNIQLC
ncbi:MAG: tyrosine-type recombinase/integrase [Lachnospiraceae bacterium]|nr:tyrosine-type recombinase/integrase [Lachnospiraceae bacterium]